MGDIHVSLSGVDYEQFSTKRVYGVQMYELSYKLCIHFGQKRGLLDFSARIDDMEIGSATMDFAEAGGEMKRGNSIDQNKLDNTCAIQ